LEAIGNNDILQACATSLAGVLIFLTIERKLETKQNEEFVYSLIGRRAEADFEIKRRAKRLEKVSKELSHLQTKSRPSDSDSISRRLEYLNEEKDSLEGDTERYRNELETVNELLKNGLDRLSLDHEQVLINQRLKELEDGVTFATLALLSSCIVFMMLVNNDWKYFTIDYAIVSKLLFSFGLLFLMIRVVLRIKDPSGTSRVFGIGSLFKGHRETSD
jgi:hypothetical protein